VFFILILLKQNKKWCQLSAINVKSRIRDVVIHFKMTQRFLDRVLQMQQNVESTNGKVS